MKVETLIEILNPNVIDLGRKKKGKKIRIDSRLVEAGDIFIAIKGKEKDGHTYIDDVIKKKPSVIIASKLEERWKHQNVTILEVDDTISAMQKIAKYIRNCYSIPVVAITGSVGKTTTKELVYELLKTKYQVRKSPKNYNNQIGIPLTLFELNIKDQILVLELGMNHKNEISELSKLCCPDVSLITNIGTAHIGYLKGKKNIAKAKLEILDGMESGYFIKNPYDPYLKKVKSKSVEIINPEIDTKLFFTNVKLFQTKTYALLHYKNECYPVTVHIPGKRILENILLALQVGLLFQISIEEMISVVENFKLPFGRGTFLSGNNNVTVINDTYNASLESLENNLISLKLASKEKYLIFGDFLELGTYTKKIHKKASKMIRKIPNLHVILIGPNAKIMRKYLKHSIWFLNIEDCISYLETNQLSNCCVLVKGSRRMHMDKIVSYLTKKD